MWVATCPRCGFAVRWNPRGAREPWRTWQRIDVLNRRLGVAALSALLAALFCFLLTGFVVDQGSRFDNYASLNNTGRTNLLASYLVFSILATLAMATCIATISYRKFAVCVACAAGCILLCMTPVATVGLFVFADSHASWTRTFGALMEYRFPSARCLAALAVVPIVALIIAALLTAARHWIGVFVKRRFRSMHAFHSHTASRPATLA